MRNGRVARHTRTVLLRLYPPAWRERYGDEFLALIEHDPLRVRTAIDIVVSACVERVATIFRLKSARARRFVRGCARFGLSIALIAAGVIASSILALAMTTLPWRGERGEFALPSLLVVVQTIALQVRYSRVHRGRPWRTQPPLGPLSTGGLVTLWVACIAILATAKWIQWTSAPVMPLELEGWPFWAWRLIQDPSRTIFVSPFMMAAAATIYHGWPNLRVSAEPAEVPRHPLGLA